MLMLYHISLVSVIKLCQCIIIIRLFIWLEGFSLLCLITCCDSTFLSWLLLPGLAGHVFSLVYQAKECHLFKMVFYYILFVQSQKAEHHADPPKLSSFSTNDCYPRINTGYLLPVHDHSFPPNVACLVCYVAHDTMVTNSALTHNH